MRCSSLRSLYYRPVSPPSYKAYSTMSYPVIFISMYMHIGNIEGAKKCYMDAIKIKPDFAIGLNNLAGVLKDEGKREEAIGYYREAIRLCPLFADSYSNLGCVLKETQQMEGAMEAYNKALELRPDFAIAHANLGVCYYDGGDIPRAIDSFQKAILIEPNFPDCLVSQNAIQYNTIDVLLTRCFVYVYVH